jgi:hypothetical protein
MVGSFLFWLKIDCYTMLLVFVGQALFAWSALSIGGERSAVDPNGDPTSDPKPIHDL